MDRRKFLQRLGMAASIAVLSRSGGLQALGNDSWQQAFHAALAEKPWLAGWKNFGEAALAERALAWHGTPPRGLTGTLLRNGPARFERDGLRYQHWFDGDGLVQAWRIEEGRVRHRARMVGTDKFLDEQAAGRFTRPATGTWIPNARSMRTSDDINVANTSILHHADRVYALWEGGSAWELEPETLASKGPRHWRPDLESVPFSAHPLRDRDGSLWNFGLAAFMPKPTLLVWHVGADGELTSLTPLPLTAPGYLHSFAMTRQHLIFVLAPWLYDQSADGAFFQRMRWQPDAGCEVVVVAKDALDRPRRFQLPGGIAFHYAQAWERGNRIVLQACWADDADALNAELAGLMRGRAPDPSTAAQESLLRIELPLSGAGEARFQPLGVRNVEFPTWDTGHDGPGGRTYLVAKSRAEVPYFDSVVAVDPRRDRVDRFHYGDGWLAEEHLFVPAANQTRRDRGWLLGTALDSQRGRLCLSVFDAARVADGPLCQASLPQTLPLGFHGTFIPS